MLGVTLLLVDQKEILFIPPRFEAVEGHDEHFVPFYSAYRGDAIVIICQDGGRNGDLIVDVYGITHRILRRIEVRKLFVVDAQIHIFLRGSVKNFLHKSLTREEW